MSEYCPDGLDDARERKHERFDLHVSLYPVVLFVYIYVHDCVHRGRDSLL